MSCDPSIGVSAIIELLRQSLCGNNAYVFIVLGWLLVLGLSAALSIITLGITASIGGTVRYLFWQAHAAFFAV